MPTALLRYAPSLMNLGRRLFSPGPWKKTLMQQRAKGLGKEPITKEVQRRVAAGSAPRTVPAGGLGYGPTVSRGLGGRFAKGKMRVPVTKDMPKGLVQQHPLIAAGITAPFAYGAGQKIYGGLAGEEEAVPGTVTPPTPEWAAPEDLLSFSEQAKADAEKGKSDMPDTPQVAYRRLTDVGMGPKEAMEITGQVAQLMGKTETERALNNLRNVLASQGEEAAASLLMMYWSTGQLEGAPEYAKEDELYQAALAAVRGGGLGATEPTGEEIGEITLA